MNICCSMLKPILIYLLEGPLVIWNSFQLLQVIELSKKWCTFQEISLTLWKFTFTNKEPIRYTGRGDYTGEETDQTGEALKRARPVLRILKGYGVVEAACARKKPLRKSFGFLKMTPNREEGSERILCTVMHVHRIIAKSLTNQCLRSLSQSIPLPPKMTGMKGVWPRITESHPRCTH